MGTNFFVEIPPASGTVIASSNVDTTPLAGRLVAVVGYGTMGRMRGFLQEIESGAFAEEFLRRHGETAGLAAAETDGPLAAEGRRVLP